MEDHEKGQQLTFGQKAVGVSVNPTDTPELIKCRQGFADLADQLNDFRNRADASPDQKRLASVAITEIEGTVMRALKALAWKD